MSARGFSKLNGEETGVWQSTGGQCCSYSRSQQPLVALVGNSIFLSLLTKRRFWLPQFICAGTVILMTILYAVFMTPWNENEPHKNFTPDMDVSLPDDIGDMNGNGVFFNAGIDSAGKPFNITLPYTEDDSPLAYVSVFGRIGKTLHIKDVLHQMAMLLVAQGLMPQIAMSFQLIMHAIRQRRKISMLTKSRLLAHSSENAVYVSDCCCCLPNVSAQFQLAGTGFLIMFLQFLAFYSFLYYTGNVAESLTPAGTVQRAVSALFIQQVPNNMFSFIKKMHPKLATEMVDSVKELEKGMVEVEEELEQRDGHNDIEMGSQAYAPPTVKLER
jgi:hypothetical protein